jgi:type II secretory pathway component PulJ
MGKKSGFTLIEAVLFMMVLSIMLVVIIVCIKEMKRQGQTQEQQTGFNPKPWKADTNGW